MQKFNVGIGFVQIFARNKFVRFKKTRTGYSKMYARALQIIFMHGVYFTHAIPSFSWRNISSRRRPKKNKFVCVSALFIITRAVKSLAKSAARRVELQHRVRMCRPFSPVRKWRGNCEPPGPKLNYPTGCRAGI